MLLLASPSAALTGMHGQAGFFDRTELLPRTVHGATCLYTMAADGRFVVDRHPRLDAVMVVSPCSGHGFKHSAGLGEAIAQQLLGETPFASLAPFALGASPEPAPTGY